MSELAHFVATTVLYRCRRSLSAIRENPPTLGSIATPRIEPIVPITKSAINFRRVVYGLACVFLLPTHSIPYVVGHPASAFLVSPLPSCPLLGSRSESPKTAGAHYAIEMIPQAGLVRQFFAKESIVVGSSSRNISIIMIVRHDGFLPSLPDQAKASMIGVERDVPIGRRFRQPEAARRTHPIREEDPS
jgi:hypothetical protein